ncbi:hypothetical protein [Psychrobacter aquaticus]|uniref:Uncharacterized protein n=1 Tax=Psychrobacter aquaticus CMS 56 TaxID=1354303 RepID=U4TC76_9GAMM|nr:hypothetical protein [Psychrobacter aquaticus]ERL56349.1 hypothetical protein M917_1027 [Psychrobacter aquaticus CMS 56]
MNNVHTPASNESLSYTAEAKKTTNVLIKHIELITRACIEQGGLIAHQSENQKAIDDLKKVRLGFYIDDIDGFQLSGSVVRYVNHITQTSRLRASSKTLSGLIEELESSIDFYHLAKSHDGHDVIHYENELQESIINIIAELNSITLHFSYQVYNTLNIIEDLDIRIKENEKSLNTISQLNQIFSRLTVNQLSEWARQSSFLQSLLLKVMKSAIDNGIKELINSGHQLRQNLAKLQQDKQHQKLNHLIDGFYQHYLKYPAFKPDISLLSHDTSCFNQAGVLTLTSFPDLENPLNDEFIGEIATTLSHKLIQIGSTDQTEENKAPHFVDDVTHSEAITIEQSILYSAVIQYFEALIIENGYTALSAVNAWDYLLKDNSEDISIEDWLLNVISYFYMHKEQFNPPLSIIVKEDDVKNYSGNHIVRDIVIAHTT